MWWIVVAYLIGVFPTGAIVAKAYGVDLKRAGSGNVGATNVSRVLGKLPGVLTLIGDVCKGALAVLTAAYVPTDISNYPTLAAWAAVAVVAGHCFSIPFLLRGGKGVATSLGVILAISPILALVALGAFAIAFKLSRRVSVGSLSAALLAALASLALPIQNQLQLAVYGIATIITLRHHQNIRRLLQKKEPEFRFGGGKGE